MIEAQHFIQLRIKNYKAAGGKKSLKSNNIIYYIVFNIFSECLWEISLNEKYHSWPYIKQQTLSKKSDIQVLGKLEV